MAKSKYFENKVRSQQEKFEIAHTPHGVNVCYWYIPPEFRGQEYTHDQRHAVHDLLFQMMNEQGTVVIQKQPLDEFKLPNFFRMVFRAGAETFEDLDYVLIETDRLG